MFLNNLFLACLFVVCIDRFKSRVTNFTKLVGMLMSCSEIASPGALLDLGF